MVEIKELDDKYIVVKREDAHKYLEGDHEQLFYKCLNLIGDGRVRDKKKYSNAYVVLNCDDNFSMSYLNAEFVAIITRRIHETMFENKHPLPLKIKDVAVHLVNAILMAKEGSGENI